MPIGERVRDYRLAKQLTQEELAELTGIPPTSISRIETGGRKMTLDEAVTVAQVLGVSLSMLAGTGPEPPPRDPEFPLIMQRCVRQGKQARRAVDALLEDLHLLQHA